MNNRSANKYDVTGREIFVGDTIEAFYFNPERYKAILKVVIDPADDEVCLEMIEGNEKAMALFKSYKYSAFPFIDEKTGRLRRGKIINR